MVISPVHGRIRPLVGATVSLMVFGLFGCSSSSSSTAPDAEEFAARMDAKAAQVLPDVDAALGGTLGEMTASFYSKSGSLGVWNYNARGTWTDVPHDRATAADRIANVLTQDGMKVTRKEETAASVVRGSVDGIHFTFAVSAPTTTLASVEIGSEEGLSSDGDFAENAPAVDYAALVQ